MERPSVQNELSGRPLDATVIFFQTTLGHRLVPSEAATARRASVLHRPGFEYDAAPGRQVVELTFCRLIIAELSRSISTSACRLCRSRKIVATASVRPCRV